MRIGVGEEQELRLIIDMPRSGLGRFDIRPRMTPEDWVPPAVGSLGS